MIIILNKVDSVESPEEVIPKKVESLRKIFSKTKYGSNIPIVLFSNKEPQNHLATLVNTLLETISIPKRDPGGSFLMLIDHCFPIKGKGSVVTGTVIEGSIRPN